MTYIIGILGKIGAGKSTFIKLLKEYIDADFFSADAENKEMLSDTHYLEILKEYFPDCFLDNSLDKNKLKDLIFQDETKNELLRSISHGVIKTRLERKIQSSEKRVIFVEISVYVNNFIDFDELWLVTCNWNKQVKRLSARDNIDEKTAYNRINFQYIPDEKVFSNIIVNDGNLVSLSEQAKFLANSVKVALNLSE